MNASAARAHTLRVGEAGVGGLHEGAGGGDGLLPQPRQAERALGTDALAQQRLALQPVKDAGQLVLAQQLPLAVRLEAAQRHHAVDGAKVGHEVAGLAPQLGHVQLGQLALHQRQK
jgi:hypothetical protein